MLLIIYQDEYSTHKQMLAHTHTHMYSISENFSFGLTMLHPRTKGQLTKLSTSDVKSPLLSCMLGLSKRLPKYFWSWLLPLAALEVEGKFVLRKTPCTSEPEPRPH